MVGPRQNATKPPRHEIRHALCTDKRVITTGRKEKKAKLLIQPGMYDQNGFSLSRKRNYDVIEQVYPIY